VYTQWLWTLFTINKVSTYINFRNSLKLEFCAYLNPNQICTATDNVRNKQISIQSYICIAHVVTYIHQK